ncbi:MAG: Gfo/Idh/MocA family oxidoreductase [Proteobacteria bacterium]|nr:Gfo/Idh/MocA family oxidoreductase [Desulfobacula sp.]MBU3915272.1 Gfo/Idh/MocA family oxidoreductase [bacterium]MBU4132006.1 Gfo/Idh/MocA family oxidoreductase [Pseudomonadota bacterium]
MERFALIGAAGYVAPKHMKAIKETHNLLTAALDPNDSVGIIDNYFPGADFFTEFERFDRYIDKKRRKGEKIDYISICSPNYLHDAHIRFALRNNACAICEKPLVLNPWNIDGLEEIESETGARVYNILQLRHHPSLIELKRQVDAQKKDRKYEIDLTYITSRGNWYSRSWKGYSEKSGGIATNIGIHFYDMLIWIFGAVQENEVHLFEADKSAGFLELENARVRWFLSVDEATLPGNIRAAGQRTYRSMTINGKEIEFSTGFTDLHTLSYEGILAGDGFGLQDARPSIETVYTIRNKIPNLKKGELHPFIKQGLLSLKI